MKKGILVVLLFILLAVKLTGNEQTGFDDKFYGNSYGYYIAFEDNRIYYYLQNKPKLYTHSEYGYGKYKVDYEKQIIKIKVAEHPIMQIPTKSFYLHFADPELEPGEFKFIIADNTNEFIEHCLLSYKTRCTRDTLNIFSGEFTFNSKDDKHLSNSMVNIGGFWWNDVRVDLANYDGGCFYIFLASGKQFPPYQKTVIIEYEIVAGELNDKAWIRAKLQNSKISHDLYSEQPKTRNFK